MQLKRGWIVSHTVLYARLAGRDNHWLAPKCVSLHAQIERLGHAIRQILVWTRDLEGTPMAKPLFRDDLWVLIKLVLPSWN
jgi:hypothetical protein